MNNYRKANTELKIEIKKDAIQSNDGSIHLYEDEQKKFTGKAPKIEWKATRFSPKVKKGVSPDTVFESPESRQTPFLSRQRVATLGFLMYPRFC
ncbi:MULTISPECIES: hypothetical protein [Priestia]|nr:MULTISPECIES: hypothetical protein [Priestia]MBG9929931.1 hypothetical protein [Priestia aryabhattai]